MESKKQTCFSSLMSFLKNRLQSSIFDPMLICVVLHDQALLETYVQKLQTVFLL